MSGPYPEGWPKKQRFGLGTGTIVEVVPLSDAERMREALEEVQRYVSDTNGPSTIALIADIALNPERGK